MGADAYADGRVDEEPLTRAPTRAPIDPPMDRSVRAHVVAAVLPGVSTPREGIEPRSLKGVLCRVWSTTLQYYL